jgi:hypothetical protein
MRHIQIITCVICALMIGGAAHLASAQIPQTISYQGVLTDGAGTPEPDGSYNITFSLYTVAGGGTALWTETQSVQVTGGIFSVILGAQTPLAVAFDQPYWLGVSVNGGQEFSPRRELTSAAYSLNARSLAQGQAVTTLNTLTDDVTLAAGDNVTITTSSDSIIVSSTGGGSSLDWSLTGNTGTTPGTHFLGTTDDQALELHVNGSRVLRLEPDAISPNILAGNSANTIDGGLVGVVIAGGGNETDPNQVTGTWGNYGVIGGGNGNLVSSTGGTIGGGVGNEVHGEHSVIGGGWSNLALDQDAVVIGGGSQNVAHGEWSVIAGGIENQTAEFADATAVSGGYQNVASGAFSAIGGGQENETAGAYAVVGGGQENLASGERSVVGGGFDNGATGDNSVVAGGSSNIATGSWATVPGGFGNAAAGGYSFAAGRLAQADHGGSFVWADSSDNAAFATTASDQFLIRAAGGVGIGTNTPQQELDVAGSVRMIGFDMPNGAGAGYVLTSDAAGQGSWQPAAGGSAWGLSGNAGTTPSTNFLGTTDNQALELHVNSTRVLRFEPNLVSPNIVAGHPDNALAPGVLGATISGGGEITRRNQVTDIYGVVGGGVDNLAGHDDGSSSNQPAATVGGGENNTASAQHSTVAGGSGNVASGVYSFVGGGLTNQAGFDNAVVAGGNANTASAFLAFVGGGGLNNATHSATVVSGGFHNNATGEYATVGGGNGNVASGRLANVSGGYNNEALGARSVIGGGFDNQATDSTATIGGGEDNIASGHHSTVAGGDGNEASNAWSTVGGGWHNYASGAYSTVAGGQNNNASNRAAVGGGQGNQATNVFATVSGGYNSRASGYGATVVGGRENYASGDYSVAAGSRVIINASHHGAIVFADSSEHFFYSAAEDEFAVRATGGVRLVTGVDGTGTPIAGATLASGSGTWGSLSDRNAKTNFEPVDADEILQRVADLKISSWNYKAQDPSIRHIGPVAQDFYSAFELGATDKRITTVDADGVSLAAIQALNKKLREKDAQISDLEQRIAQLEAIVMKEGGRGK